MGDTIPAGLYLINALKACVDESDKKLKKLVLDSLPIARSLVEIVVEKGWTEDAAPVLVKVLAHHKLWALPRPDLPTEWIEAVASLGREDTYGDLKAYLYQRDNRYLTWKAIHSLPGMDLSRDVDSLWRWAKTQDVQYRRISIAAIAAHYGYLDALEALFRHGRWPAWDVVERLTPYRGRPDRPQDMVKWFEAHGKHLVFDRKACRYRLKE